MFPEDVLFEYVLATLAEEVVAHVTPAPDPLPYDRWIARSALQKGVRRGDVGLALRALATLFAYDVRAVWRGLIVIAMEDVGVAGMDVIAAVVAAATHRAWRAQVGGDWRVASLLVEQMCASVHCQAACDLLLRGLNDPMLDAHRAEMLEADAAALADVIGGAGRPIEHRGMAALAFGGGLADGQRHRDPYAVFDVLADSGYASHVVATCRAAWRVGRNEMAMLLPLVWREWMQVDHALVDDEMPRVTMVRELPGYVIDQFTRVGGDVARSLLKADPTLRRGLARAGIAAARQPRAVGDLLFVVEGGLVSRRAIWPVGDELRLPIRMMPAAASLGDRTGEALEHIAAKASLIAKLRVQHLHPVCR